jgi:hypothetical protein
MRTSLAIPTPRSPSYAPVKAAARHPSLSVSAARSEATSPRALSRLGRARATFSCAVRVGQEVEGLAAQPHGDGVGLSSLAAHRRKVDFPEPEGPSRR